MAAHAELGASSAVRWMTCPGSVRLCRDIPDTESDYAREGSAAHALGEVCLLRKEDPWEYLGEPCPSEEFGDIEVSADMVEAVTVYVEHIRKTYGLNPSEKMIERRVSLEKLGSWAKGMFGTADFILAWATKKTLHVDDYKHGQGVAVEVEDNPQLMYYGLAALFTMDLLNMIEQVTVTVVQPRKPHPDGPIRSVTYSVDELLAWGEKELKPAVLATDDPDAPLVPSEKGCKFCAAKGSCPARAEQAMDNAMLDFDEEGGVAPKKKLDQLTPAEIAQILDAEKDIKDWLKGVAEYAQRSFNNGVDVTDGRYKLVAGRSSRNWTSEEAAIEKLHELGLEDDDLYTRKFATPAQVEKMVGKDQRKELADLIVKQKGSPTLAPADDKRPAIQRDPESDFME